MTDIETLTKKLLANFRTFDVAAEPLPTPPNPRPADWWWTMAKARVTQQGAVFAFRDGIRRVLYQHRHRFLDHLELDSDGCSRLHVFVLDEAALSLLDNIDGGNVGHGDPVNFDPEELIIERLRESDWFTP
jgi:hypothetical protein